MLIKKVRLGVLLILLSCLPMMAQAIDFSFTDTEGNSHQLADYKGKWVVVNFWATWCPPCRKEIPDLSDFHLENDDAVVIGVNYEPGISDARLKKFIELYLIAYPITRANDDIIQALGDPRGLPTSILINPESNIARRITGMVDGRRLNKIIAQQQAKMQQEK